MSTSWLTLFTLAVIVPTFIAYELCGVSELITGVTLEVGRIADTEEVVITTTGPSDVWFGYGFGSPRMPGSYAVTLENRPAEVIERLLTQSNGGGVLGKEIPGTPSGNITINNAQTEFSLTRPYAFNGAFDFTDFMTCKVAEIDIIAAIGDVSISGTTIGYHATRRRDRKLTRICSCPTSAPTTAVPTTTAPTTAAPTTAVPTSTPTTAAPTTADPTLAQGVTAMPTTAEPTTADPTTYEPTTSEPTTAIPTTAEPTTDAPTAIAEPSGIFGGYEECVAPTELKNGLSVSIGRRRSDKTMLITMKGTVTRYYAYGFGGEIMDGTYTISIEGAVDEAKAVERILGPRRAGTVIDDGSIIDVHFEHLSGIRTVNITRKYAYGTTYDFTPLLTCELEEIDAIAAEGDSVRFGYHQFGKAVGTLTRSCDCDATTAEPDTESDDVNDDSSANDIFNPFYIGLIVGLSHYFVA